MLYLVQWHNYSKSILAPFLAQRWRGQTIVIVIVMIGNDAFANLCQIVNVTGVLDGEFSADSGYVFNFAIGLVVF